LKIIEIIGPPCSGKTYLRTSIKRKLNKEGVLIHTYKSLFFDYVFKEKDLSIIDRLTLCYFKFLKLKKEEPLIKNKKSKKNDTKLKFNNYISKFLYKNYFKICKKFTQKENSKIQNLIFEKIEKNKIVNNTGRNVFLWFIELFSFLYVVKKNIKKNNVIIDDEGIFQKLFVFAEIRFDKKFIKNYITAINIVDFVIHINSSKKNIQLRSNDRKFTNKFFYKNKTQLKKILNFDIEITKYIKNEKKIIFKEIYNKKKESQFYHFIKKNINYGQYK
jgi:hypothetical protein